MLVGYARVSTEDQNLDLQRDALTEAGCERNFTDVASGAKDDRTGLAEALAFLRPGDTLVVWKLDRLGRSLKHLIETVTTLQARKVGSSVHYSVTDPRLFKLLELAKAILTTSLEGSGHLLAELEGLNFTERGRRARRSP